MKQIRLCLSVIVSFGLVFLWPAKTFALEAASPSLIITEIKIKNDTAPGGFNEFIELYNADITSLDLNDYTIEYFNNPSPAAADQPIKKVVVADGQLLPTQAIVLAADTSQIPGSLASPFSSLADSGGLVRLYDLEGNLQDQVSWTSTSSLAISPVVFLSTSTSNKPNSFIRSLDEQSSPELTDPQWQLLTPTPHADSLTPVPEPEPEPEIIAPIPLTQPPIDPITIVPEPAVSQSESSSPGLLPLQITELLPNPMAPATDSMDEYIELYNPNDQAVSLKDYRLQSGSSFSYNHTFGEASIGPHEYKALYVPETRTLLANSGGKARLLDPSGQVISETSAYDAADEGAAWAIVAGTWQWTTTPTPNSANQLTLPLVKPVKAVAAKAPAKKAKVAPKTTAKKASAKKATAKPKAAKSGVAPINTNDEEEAEVSRLHPGIIAGVGLLAVAYAIYEYRFDIRNRLYQLGRYRAARAASRAKA